MGDRIAVESDVIGNPSGFVSRQDREERLGLRMIRAVHISSGRAIGLDRLHVAAEVAIEHVDDLLADGLDEIGFCSIVRLSGLQTDSGRFQPFQIGCGLLFFFVLFGRLAVAGGSSVSCLFSWFLVARARVC